MRIPRGQILDWYLWRSRFFFDSPEHALNVSGHFCTIWDFCQGTGIPRNSEEFLGIPKTI